MKTNRDVCAAIAAEMGGYNGGRDVDVAGIELAIDLAAELGIDMDSLATVETIAAMRGACDMPLF